MCVQHTEQHRVEFIGPEVQVGHEDATRLQNSQELSLSWCSECGEEGVAGLGGPLLKHRRVVSHRTHLLHRHGLCQRPTSLGLLCSFFRNC